MNSFLAELAALVQATRLLRMSPQFDTAGVESYGQRRQEIFSRLQQLTTLDVQGEEEALRTVLVQLQEQDRLLLQQLEGQQARCREALLTLAKARQAAKESTPSFAGHLFERRL